MSTPFETILVAVDFGEASARALQLASALSGRTGARLTVLHAEALDAPPYFTQAQMEALEREARATRARAVEFLRAFARRHVEGPFEAVIETRSPTDAILHASAGASLVVMGTHGRRGPSRWWLGSVAERVLRETPVPLLVAHAEDAGRAAADAFREGMLVLPPGDVEAPRTRSMADAVAGAFGGHVFPVSTDDPRVARRGTGATWAAVPAPTPRTSRWLSQVGEPLVTSCTLPVLFVPEADGGPVV